MRKAEIRNPKSEIRKKSEIRIPNEEDTRQWHRRRFYGVTIASRNSGAQNVLVDVGGAGELPSPVLSLAALPWMALN
jgi:hypothetical protein